MGDNDSLCFTVDLTIEIDEEVAQGISSNENSTRKRGPWIRPPLELNDVCIETANSLSIANLSDDAHALLVSHLSMPSYGTLKNWDSIGIHLGITDHESLRQETRPMEAVLRRCRLCPASDLIKALELCERIDMLYSLKKLQDTGRLGKSYESSGTNSLSTSLVAPHAVLGNVDTQGIKTILLVHYEENHCEMKNFKWLRKNLVGNHWVDGHHFAAAGLTLLPGALHREHATRRGFHVIDIADLDFDANLTSVLEEVFIKALHIVVSFTLSHIEAVKTRNTTCRSVIYAHDLMNQEFCTLNSINRRFRAVTFNDTQPSDLPVGWPKSTLVYQFPTNMAALCAKIFKSNVNSMYTT